MKIVLVFEKPAFSGIQLSMTSNLEQNRSMIYLTEVLNISKKSIETGFVTSPKNRLPIHLNNYWWARMSICVCSTILEITKLYIFLLLYFTSALSLREANLSTCLRCVNSNIYSYILSSLKLSGTFFMNEMRCIYFILR